MRLSPVMPSPDLVQVLELGQLAPSVHNSQPWLFRARDERAAEVLPDLARHLRAVDPMGRQLHVSVGALLATLRWAARGLGVPLGVERARNEAPAVIELGTAAVAADEAAASAVRERRTVRAPYEPGALSGEARDALERLEAPGCSLVLVDDREQLELLAELVALGTRRAFAAPDFREELATHLDGEEGILAPATGLARAGRWLQAKALEHVDVGALQAAERRRHVVASSAVLVVVSERDDASAWSSAGELLGDAWLAATRHRLAAQPLTALVESATERAVLAEALGGGVHVQAMLRVGPCSVAVAPTPRGPVRWAR